MTIETRAEKGTAERAHALAFLRTSTGQPELNLEAGLLDDVFQALSTGGPLSGKPPCWIDDLITANRPAGKAAPLKLCLSHDVDYVTSLGQGHKLARRLSRGLFGEGRRGHALLTAAGSLVRLLTEIPRRERYGDFMEWLRLEESHGFRSTFFFLPYPDAHVNACDGDYRFTDKVRFDGRRVKVSEMMREIAALGWEVGLHGTYASAVQDGMLKRQKDQIEKIIGKEVVATRQHYLHFLPGVTHRLQAEAGLKVDSTFGFNRTVGLKPGTSHPYVLWDAEAGAPMPLVEVPFAAMDTSLVAMGLHHSGSADAVETLKALGAGIAAAGGVLCLNWHPHYLPVARIHEVYVAMLAWARDQGAVHRRFDSFAR